MYVKKSIEPSKKPERKRFAIERTPIPSKPTSKCKTHPTGHTTEPQGEFPRDHEALGPRGGSYILDAESCNIQPLELDRLLFVGNSRRFVETRLRV